MSRHAAYLGSWFSLLLAANVCAAAPSFDCAKAAEGAEQAICKDAKLAALDAAIARAYALAQDKLGGRGAKALRENQRVFLSARDAAQGLPDNDLQDRLSNQLNFLERAAAAAGGSGLVGTWENAYGIITIKRGTGELFSVEAQSGDPVSARWVCDTTDEVPLQDGALSFTDADKPQDATVTIRVLMDAALLVVSEDVKEGAVRGYCGANGFLEGTYLRVGP